MPKPQPWTPHRNQLIPPPPPLLTYQPWLCHGFVTESEWRRAKPQVNEIHPAPKPKAEPLHLAPGIHVEFDRHGDFAIAWTIGGPICCRQPEDLWAILQGRDARRVLPSKATLIELKAKTPAKAVDEAIARYIAQKGVTKVGRTKAKAKAEAAPKARGVSPEQFAQILAEMEF